MACCCTCLLQGLGNLVLALAAAHVSEAPFTERVAAAVVEQLPCFSSVDVAQAAIGLAKLGFRDKDTMQALVQRGRKLQSVLKPRHARAINRG